MTSLYELETFGTGSPDTRYLTGPRCGGRSMRVRLLTTTPCLEFLVDEFDVPPFTVGGKPFTPTDATIRYEPVVRAFVQAEIVGRRLADNGDVNDRRRFTVEHGGLDGAPEFVRLLVAQVGALRGLVQA